MTINPTPRPPLSLGDLTAITRVLDAAQQAWRSAREQVSAQVDVQHIDQALSWGPSLLAEIADLNAAGARLTGQLRTAQMATDKALADARALREQLADARDRLEQTDAHHCPEARPAIFDRLYVWKDPLAPDADGGTRPWLVAPFPRSAHDGLGPVTFALATHGQALARALEVMEPIGRRVTRVARALHDLGCTDLLADQGCSHTPTAATSAEMLAAHCALQVDAEDRSQS